MQEEACDEDQTVFGRADCWVQKIYNGVSDVLMKSGKAHASRWSARHLNNYIWAVFLAFNMSVRLEKADTSPRCHEKNKQLVKLEI